MEYLVKIIETSQIDEEKMQAFKPNKEIQIKLGFKNMFAELSTYSSFGTHKNIPYCD